ncbi:diguanylate cyclase [Alishewanella sp. HH-ZS]|uniref:GGDEF domain-containing protein n=1 Tax=Alishewanella sp. HH-ZS TaxID=1856684 RepID=UPI0008236A9B|nr:GGDEF domain-containing protein [Alishewanella sp. HH-ZS]OCW98357.1 hypothetical protein A9165_01325 [Alishewanella sp. HH-ZS]
MDILTLAMVNLFIGLAAAGSLLLLCYQYPAARYIRYWFCAACCLVSSALLGSLLQLGVAVPYWLLPAANNVAVAGIHLFILAGLAKLLHLRLPLFVVLSVCAAYYLFHFSLFAQAALSNRLLVAFPLIISVNLAALWVIYRRFDTSLKLPLTLFTVALVFNIVQISIRYSLLLAEPLQLPLPFSTQHIHSLGFFALTTFALLSFSASLLTVYRKQQLLLEYYSDHDALTGLLNRHHMEQRLKGEIQRCVRAKDRCSFLLFDIDFFKQVNDTYGHLTGDTVLRHVAALAKSHLRPYDSLFRYGGEEFLLCLPGTAADEALKVAERLRQHIDNSIIDEVPALKLTVSIGISTLVSGQNFHELVQQADQALYSAKQQGRNQSLHFQAANSD